MKITYFETDETFFALDERKIISVLYLHRVSIGERVFEPTLRTADRIYGAWYLCHR